MAFETKIRRSRFAVGSFSAEAMLTIGNVTLDAVLGRIQRGINANDEPAKPLKPGKNGRRGYPDYKSARGLQPIRDWTWRGKTLRSLKVKAVSENRAVLGFVDPEADFIAHVNNLRERAFALSLNDRKVLAAVVNETGKTVRIVRVKVA